MNDEFFAGAIDSEEPQDDTAGSIGGVSGVHKKFLDIIYNQKNVDNYACTVVATYGALSNTTGIIIPYPVMIGTIARMRKDRTFRDKFGASLDDGTRYALEDFNKYTGRKFKREKIWASFENVHNALEHSAVVHGIKYSPAILGDEEDNGTLDLPTEILKGQQGHAITWVKTNADDKNHPCQAKYLQAYAGVKVRNVIFVQDYEARRSMQFNWAYYFTE